MADWTISGAIGALEALGPKIAAIGESTMKGLAPARSGTLRGSIHTEQQGSSTWFVGTDLYYAYYVDQGRRDVWPIRARALRFEDGSFHAHAGPAKAQNFAKRTADALNAMSFSL